MKLLCNIANWNDTASSGEETESVQGHIHVNVRTSANQPLSCEYIIPNLTFWQPYRNPIWDKLISNNIALRLGIFLKYSLDNNVIANHELIWDMIHTSSIWIVDPHRLKHWFSALAVQEELLSTKFIFNNERVHLITNSARTDILELLHSLLSQKLRA